MDRKDTVDFLESPERRAREVSLAILVKMARPVFLASRVKLDCLDPVAEMEFLDLKVHQDCLECEARRVTQDCQVCPVNVDRTDTQARRASEAWMELQASPV